MAEADRLLQAVCFFGDDCDRLAKITDMCYNIIRSQFGCVLFPRRRLGNNTKEQPFCIISNTHQNWEIINYDFYDHPFSTPTKNAVNKRIIERCISFPRRRRGKDIRQEL
ncbi:hypothetical protein [uncultured Ruminococcus sp.]|uniref:hypothetical protein n=1 Tax=uncultured Ruminococcus sp. TaxID=165186 RepID=UPI0025FE40C1|nr:hypothetical protein [uncultured Ruminococcus sp.]